MNDMKGDGLSYDMQQDIAVLNSTSNFAKCVVYVRPTRNWKKDEAGENFGFDWMRIGDSEVKGDVKYAKNMGRLWLTKDTPQPNPNSTKGNFKVEPPMYRQMLNNYFSSSYNLAWKLKPTTEKSEKDAIKEEAMFKYYIPTLNIMNGQTANLQLIVDMMDSKTPPQSIECRIADTALLSVEHSKDKMLEPKKGKYECAISCKAVIKEPQIISFVAIYVKTDGTPQEEVCGFVKVLPNNNIKRLKVLFVDCWFEDRKGKINDKEISYAKKILNQALVELDYAYEAYAVPPGSITEKILKDKSSLGSFKNANEILGHLFYNQGSGLYEYFRVNKLLETYQDHIVVVAIGKECKQVSEDSTSNTAGSTNPPLGTIDFSNAMPPLSYTPSASVILLFEGRSAETLVHEILHATGLLHSFSSLSPYVYNPMITDNIMDYSHQYNIPRIATWQWQWEAIRKYIDNNSQEAAKRTTQKHNDLC